MQVDAQKEHLWLRTFIGDWTMESECSMGPDQPPMKSAGTETVRSLGEVWIIGEGKGEMPGGGTGHTVLTLGYDNKLNKFVGTFIGSMMTNLWVYNGTLDAEERVLTLDTEGPEWTQQRLTKYQDIFEIVDNNHRILRSRMLGEDGKWHSFMEAHYHRK